jgi:putative FmdB family regulatory protein
VPVYDYVCASCRQVTEVIHGIEAPGPRFCPVCGAEGTLRKTIVRTAVHFKGSGWAKKDRSSASRARAKGGAAASSGNAGDGTGKSGDAAPTAPAMDGGKAAGSASRSGETGKQGPSSGGGGAQRDES